MQSEMSRGSWRGGGVRRRRATEDDEVIVDVFHLLHRGVDEQLDALPDFHQHIVVTERQ